MATRAQGTTRLSDATLLALRHADEVIHKADRSDVFTAYDAFRAAIGALVPLDDFYVGLINEADRRISYPYVFSNGAYLEGGTLTFGPSGVVAWVLASRRPYRYADDGGALLNRGSRFGDDDLSADALVVPMVSSDGTRVVGVVGALSDTPNAFTDESAAAMEWLAALVVDRVHASDPSRNLNLGLVYPELEGEGDPSLLLAVNTACRELTAVSRELQEIATALETGGDADTARRLSEIGTRCFEIQASVITRVGPVADEPPPDPLAALSPRERAVVELVTGPLGDPGNVGIAETLGIGPATVKTHMASLLDKLGLEHRSELRWVVREGGGTGPGNGTATGNGNGHGDGNGTDSGGRGRAPRRSRSQAPASRGRRPGS